MSVLTREFLERDGVREALRARAGGQPPWTDEQLEASMSQVVPAAMCEEGAWVFGYGSLIWNPCMHVAESRRATLYGRHRALALWTRWGRGTPEHPGLMLSLAPGGSCHGVVLRVARERCREELALLWRREMVWGSYRPRVMRVRVDSGHKRAIVFDANPEHPNWCAAMPLEEQARYVRDARGFNGTNVEYLHQTVAGLRALGVADRHLERLLELCEGQGAPTAGAPRARSAAR